MDLTPSVMPAAASSSSASASVRLPERAGASMPSGDQVQVTLVSSSRTASSTTAFFLHGLPDCLGRGGRVVKVEGQGVLVGPGDGAAVDGDPGGFAVHAGGCPRPAATPPTPSRCRPAVPTAAEPGCPRRRGRAGPLPRDRPPEPGCPPGSAPGRGCPHSPAPGRSRPDRWGRPGVDRKPGPAPAPLVAVCHLVHVSHQGRHQLGSGGHGVGKGRAVRRDRAVHPQGARVLPAADGILAQLQRAILQVRYPQGLQNGPHAGQVLVQGLLQGQRGQVSPPGPGPAAGRTARRAGRWRRSRSAGRGCPSPAGTPPAAAPPPPDTAAEGSPVPPGSGPPQSTGGAPSPGA